QISKREQGPPIGLDASQGDTVRADPEELSAFGQGEGLLVCPRSDDDRAPGTRSSQSLRDRSKGGGALPVACQGARPNEGEGGVTWERLGRWKLVIGTSRAHRCAGCTRAADPPQRPLGAIRLL